MEEETTESMETRTSGGEERTKVGFPHVEREKKKSKAPLLLVIIFLLLILGGLAWYLFGRSSDEIIDEDVAPTPTEFIEERSTPTPTEAEVEREGVSIQILNGTGISGAAGELQTELEDLGYEDIAVGNASSQNTTATQVVFDPSVDDSVKDEITDKLEEIYESVTPSERSSGSYDVVITTGYPKGHKPTSGVSVSPTKATTPTVNPTGSLTPSATKTSTPTP